MAVTQTLRPFRDYDEKDVINLFALSGAVVDSTYNIVGTKGTLVKIAGDGFRNDLENLEMLGNYGTFSVNNFVAQRYGTLPKVVVAGVGDRPLGMLLYDVRELDENQLPLKYNPRKAAEMEVALSGQSVPIVTRGVFLYSGVITGTAGAGTAIAAGNPCYVGAAGCISAYGVSSSVSTITGTTSTNTGVLTVTNYAPAIGKFLGNVGAAAASGNAYGDNSAIALVWLNCA